MHMHLTHPPLSASLPPLRLSWVWYACCTTRTCAERPVYETAKRRGYLAVRGSGYRKGRKGHPLPNAYRQWCDARGWACVVVEQDASGGSGSDVVVVDLAPLRSTQLLPAVAAVERLAATVGAHRLGTADRSLEDVPFNTMPLALPHSVEQA